MIDIEVGRRNRYETIYLLQMWPKLSNYLRIKLFSQIYPERMQIVWVEITPTNRTGGDLMKCECYKNAFLPVILLLEEAQSLMYFKTPDYDEHQQHLHDIIQSMNMRFRCIDGCFRQTTLPMGDE